MSPTILTASGLTFNLLEPDPNLIEIEDIAHALSHICRFTGHTREFYSVAEHSIYVSNLVQPPHALAALLHDAAEAYIGDVSSPLKYLLPDYRAIEWKLEAAIRKRFGLPAVQHESIKHADLVMLATEKRDRLNHHDQDWELLQGIEVYPLPMNPPLSPAHAREYFLGQFVMLGGATV
jgi:hypothetical protein